MRGISRNLLGFNGPAITDYGTLVEELRHAPKEVLPPEATPMPEAKMMRLVGSKASSPRLQLELPRKMPSGGTSVNGLRNDYVKVQQVFRKMPKSENESLANILQSSDYSFSNKIKAQLQTALDREQKMICLLSEVIGMMGTISGGVLGSQEG